MLQNQNSLNLLGFETSFTSFTQMDVQILGTLRSFAVTALFLTDIKCATSITVWKVIKVIHLSYMVYKRNLFVHNKGIFLNSILCFRVPFLHHTVASIYMHSSKGASCFPSYRCRMEPLNVSKTTKSCIWASCFSWFLC